MAIEETVGGTNEPPDSPDGETKRVAAPPQNSVEYTVLLDFPI